MNYKNSHGKIVKCLESLTIQNCIENLSSLEYIMQNEVQDSQVALVPQEANFQLPNIFLKTKMNPKAEKLFSENKAFLDWDDSLEKAINFLLEIEIQMVSDSQNENIHDEKILEALIRSRFGS